MVTRNSRYGWMTVGGLLCLFALVLACKVRDGNRAHARSGPLVPVASESPEPPHAMPSIEVALPDLPAPAPKVDLPALPATGIIPAAAVLPNTPTDAKVGTDSAPILIPAGGMPPPLVSPLPGVKPPEAPPALSSPTVPSVIPPMPAVVVTPTPVGVGPTAPPAPHAAPTERAQATDAPGEPPLAPVPGPVMKFKVSRAGETFKTLAGKMLGSAERWSDIHKLNPTLATDAAIAVGTTVRLPADACNTEDGEALRALPSLRPRTLVKPRAALPLTGTFSLTLDANKGLTLPRAIQQQFGGCDTVLVSPGSDRCLWITNQAHLDRLQAKLDKSSARESDVRGFKRLYYAQTVKCGVKEGRVQITDKLAAFASLGAEVVLVGIDDHFEVWDAARWRRYTQTKKAISAEE